MVNIKTLADIESLATYGGRHQAEPMTGLMQNDFGQTTIMRTGSSDSMYLYEAVQHLFSNSSVNFGGSVQTIATYLNLLKTTYPKALQTVLKVVFHWTGTFEKVAVNDTMYDMMFDFETFSQFTLRDSLTGRPFNNTGVGAVRAYVGFSEDAITLNVSIPGEYDGAVLNDDVMSDVKLSAIELNSWGVETMNDEAGVEHLIILNKGMLVGHFTDFDTEIAEYAKTGTVLSAIQVAKIGYLCALIAEAANSASFDTVWFSDHATIRKAESSVAEADYMKLHWDWGVSMPWLWVNRFMISSIVSGVPSAYTKPSEVLSDYSFAINFVKSLSSSTMDTAEVELKLEAEENLFGFLLNDSMLVPDISPEDVKILTALYKTPTDITAPRTFREEWTTDYGVANVSIALVNNKYLEEANFVKIVFVDSQISLTKNFFVYGVKSWLGVADSGFVPVNPSVVYDVIEDALYAVKNTLEENAPLVDTESDVETNDDKIAAVQILLDELSANKIAAYESIDLVPESEKNDYITKCNNLSDLWEKYVGKGSQRVTLYTESDDEATNFFNALDPNIPGAHAAYHFNGTYGDVVEDIGDIVELVGILLTIIPIGAVVGKVLGPVTRVLGAAFKGFLNTATSVNKQLIETAMEVAIQKEGALIVKEGMDNATVKALGRSATMPQIAAIKTANYPSLILSESLGEQILAKNNVSEVADLTTEVITSTAIAIRKELTPLVMRESTTASVLKRVANSAAECTGNDVVIGTRTFIKTKFGANAEDAIIVVDDLPLAPNSARINKAKIAGLIGTGLGLADVLFAGKISTWLSQNVMLFNAKLEALGLNSPAGYAFLQNTTGVLTGFGEMMKQAGSLYTATTTTGAASEDGIFAQDFGDTEIDLSKYTGIIKLVNGWGVK